MTGGRTLDSLANSGEGAAKKRSNEAASELPAARHGVIQVEYKRDSPPGALVSDVTPFGPADQAGIMPGDRIVDFNGTPLANGSAFTKWMEITVPGDVVHLGVLRRDGKRDSVVVTTR